MILYYILLGLFFVLRAYMTIMIIGIILTWFPNSYEYKIPRLIRNMTNWYLGYFRGVFVIGNLDFTSVFGILLYEGILDLILLII